MDKTDFERLHVLVLDDNRHFVKLMTEVLRSFGARDVYACVDVTSALEIVNSEFLDIATVDVKMPDMNGFEFVRTVRMAKGTPNRMMPIIMVSGNGTRLAVGQAVGCGAEEFLIKPIKPITLYKRIVTLIDHPHPYIETENYFGPERRRELADRFEGAERRTATMAKIVSRHNKGSEVT